MQKIVSFEDLANADLIVDTLYKGGDKDNASDDPISKLLKCCNRRGFRYRGTINTFKVDYVVLYTTLTDPDWPDSLDEQTGRFVYFGDNKRPGHELHDTPGKGNIILRETFDRLHSGERHLIPPYFVFQKGGIGRDVIFRGLAVPGAEGLDSNSDLVAIWKSKNSLRFQNYKAVFTILNMEKISREWITDLQNKLRFTSNAPKTWIDWVENGHYNSLRAERSVEYRTWEEQLPASTEDLAIIQDIYKHFKDDPYAFEKCAVEIVKLMDPNVFECDLTRPYRDGGRDAVGKYRIGLNSNSISVDFALEAKRYQLEYGVGVKDTCRLISRLRHRQFGILMTTSFVNEQAYKEIREDGHPIIIVSARDIVSVLKRSGYTTRDKVKMWLNENF